MVSVTSPPARNAPANSKMQAINSAVFKEIAPKESLFLEMKKKENHAIQVIEYLKNNSYPKSQDLLKHWSWSNSALVVKDLLIEKCRLYYFD